ncbi:RIP metalloprotease RseP [Hydrogenivirga sp. 128-5-R1-1]|uniref:RIP metalloprotease RseP n=1 Tax=Hydrogenivirga sp. 128-5-R1-1 TaxID=392423 RepID=UPI00015F2385|nr:RIP metalloprotease RseP [Hydrogenivirga sp. 128-5-R1-1]EDP74006.1 hypothetical protein HG1285_04548 [Hydrogenivirga sp. 128-5-R1-1]
MVSVIAFLIMLGVLITIHELGHFLFAKMFGVKIEVFSIGFGKPIFRWKGKETVYQVALVPLGGYVKMYGEDSMTEPIQGETEKNINDPRSFISKPRWQKMLIAFAGPLFNIIFAVVAFAVAYMIGIQQPDYMKKPVVVGYVEKESPAEKAGIKPFDKITEVDNEPVRTWKEFTLKTGLKAGKTVILTVNRNGKNINIKVAVPENINKKSLGIAPLIPPVIGKILPYTPAEKSGLELGDKILAVNGKPVRSWYEFVDLMSSFNKNEALTLLIKRDGKVLSITLKPKYNSKLKKYIIGVSPKFDVNIVKYSFFEAFEKSIDKTLELTVAIGKVIKGLITGEVSIKTLGGPVAIAQFSGQALETGIATYLFAMAFISLQLGYLNLLPIPVLDGGLIALLLVESIIRRPLPEKAKEYLAYVGFAILGTLMIFVIFNDILRVLQ